MTSGGWRGGPTRRLAAALVALALAAGAGCGGGGEPRAAREPAPIVRETAGGGQPPIVTETVGRGVQQSTILRPDVPGPLPVVVFLHGWGAPDPAFYRPWLEHLARRGNAVVYPRYQDSFVEPPRQALGNVLAVVRIALERRPAQPRTLVVAGHSAGGALAADYAAIARTAGVPAPRAVFAAYPGRRLPRVPRGLPEIPPALIPASTRVQALASRGDGVVGTATARAIVRGARRVPRDRRRLVLMRDPAVADHQAPQRADAASRRTFWAALDRLIARARR